VQASEMIFLFRIEGVTYLTKCVALIFSMNLGWNCLGLHLSEMMEMVPAVISGGCCPHNPHGYEH